MSEGKKPDRTIPGIALSVLFSILFLLASCKIFGRATAVLYPVLILISLLGVYASILWWKAGIRESRSRSLLFWMFLVDYWVWLLFADYPFFSSYIFLFAIEAHRLFCLIQLIRSIEGARSIDTIWNWYLLRILFIDIALFVFQGKLQGPSDNLWYQNEILHPLFSGPKFPFFFWVYTGSVELSFVALYAVKFKTKKKREQSNDQ